MADAPQILHYVNEFEQVEGTVEELLLKRNDQSLTQKVIQDVSIG